MAEVLVILSDPSNSHRLSLATKCIQILGEKSIQTEIRATYDDNEIDDVPEP